MNSSEQRAAPPSANSATVKLSVLVDGERQDDWIVEGVGGRGLFMRRGTAPAPVHLPGSVFRLSWHDGNGKLLLTVAAQVRDSDSNGARLSLVETDPAVVEQIQELSQHLPSSGKAPLPSKASARPDRQLDVVSNSIAGSLSRRCKNLLDQALLGLEQVALDATAEVASMPARLALQRMQSAAAGLVEHFTRRLLDGCSDRGPLTAERSFDGASMQLVDDGEMQIWLTRRESARLIERQVHGPWQRLRALLNLVAQAHPGFDPQLLAADSILDALLQAGKRVGLEAPLQHFLLRLCEQSSVLNLAAYYEELQIDLQRIGVRLPVPAGRDDELASSGARAPISLAASASAPAPVRAGALQSPRPENALSTTRRIWSQAKTAQQLPADAAPAPAVSDADVMRAMREMLSNPDAPNGNAQQFRAALQQRAAAIHGDQHAKPDAR